MPDAILPSPLVFPETTCHGCNSILGLIREGSRFGTRGVIFHGRALVDSPVLDSLLNQIPMGVKILPLRHQGGEPTLAQLSLLLSHLRTHQAQWVAGIGGGSVLDLAKAAAALIHTTQPPAHYHDGAPITPQGIPFIAVPTTAGTGSEATLNSVLTNELTGVKKSIRDPTMMPRIVILDPSLLSTCPPDVIAASGMDALTQAIEAFTSLHASWLSDTLALKACRLIADNLSAVRLNPRATQAGFLLTGSYLAGLALSSARLGIVHGLAHPLGALYHLPHGIVCAACLPWAIKLNREAFGAKYNLLTDAVGGDLTERINDLLADLAIQSPFAGKPCPSRERIIAETLASGSTKANPKTISRQDVDWMLDRLFAP